MVRISAPVTLVALACLSAASAQTAQTSPMPNWVGPRTGRATDTACYRKTVRSATACPLGYDSDKLGGCWAQCPLEYPVACAMECLPQGKDCGIQVITKIGTVAEAAIQLASSGIMSGLVGKQASQGIKCGGGLFMVVTKMVAAVSELQQATPNLKPEQLVEQLTKLDLVSIELPATLLKCAGAPSLIATPVATIAKKLVDLIAGRGKAVLAPAAFVQLTKDAGINEPLATMPASDFDKFMQLIANGPACGMQLADGLDRIVKAIVELKKKNPKMTLEQLRIELPKTELFRTELPKFTATCAAGASASADAFDVRDMVRKAFQGFIDKVVEASDQNGKPATPEQFTMKAVELGLDKLLVIDVFGIVALVKEFMQPICGPTTLMGEIDDGPATLALGLSPVGAAFSGSTGQWTKAGNGEAKIVLESRDTKDVTVNVFSGGTKIASVPVAKGKTVVWTKPVKGLEDKTLYLERSRPGFLGIPMTDGGSLLAWVPHSSSGGNFELHAAMRAT